MLLAGITTHAFGFATAMQVIKGGDTIVFSSNTDSYDIYLNNQPVGRSNGSAFIYKVPRDGKPKVFTFKKAGYQDTSITLTKSFDNLFWGNLLIGGSVGSSTDSWFTSNSQEYSPNQFFVQLNKN